MFKKSIDKLKENFQKDGNQKKKIENLVLFLVLLIIIVLVINFVWLPEESPTVSDKQFVSSGVTDNNTINNINQNSADVVSNEYNLVNELERYIRKNKWGRDC